MSDTLSKKQEMAWNAASEMRGDCNERLLCTIENYMIAVEEEAISLQAEIARLNKVADWLAQAAANGACGGVRRGAEFWREEAERMVNENGE